jgi:hypothetical protein
MIVLPPSFQAPKRHGLGAVPAAPAPVVRKSASDAWYDFATVANVLGIVGSLLKGKPL